MQQTVLLNIQTRLLQIQSLLYTHKLIPLKLTRQREKQKIKDTSANIVFAKGGVEYIIEKPYAFSRNLLFILLFFVG